MTKVFDCQWYGAPVIKVTGKDRYLYSSKAVPDDFPLATCQRQECGETYLTLAEAQEIERRA